MKHLDLFSGIGGFALGLGRAGFTPVAFSEIDPYASRVLARHWPSVPNLGDVTKADFPHADIITAGFPCQDISNAGLCAGITGERSGLWREVVRAICVVRPRVALMENVAALLGRGLDRVLGDLAEVGHDAEWDCVPATAVGLPHRRDRIWIAAYPQRDEQSRQEPCLGALGRVGRFLQPAPGDGDWKAALASLRGMDDGLSRSVDRTDGLRNAIVPQIAEAIGRALLYRAADDLAVAA